MNVQNALAATAAAYAAGAHLHDIRQGLRTFSTSYYQAPGRLNLFELDGVKVLVDYAHNPAALDALGQFVDSMTSAASGSGRRACASASSPRRVTAVTRTSGSSAGSRPATSTS